MQRSNQTTYIDLLGLALRCDAGNLKRKADAAHQADPERFRPIPAYRRVLSIADAVFEGGPHPHVALVACEVIDSEYDEGDDEFETGDEGGLGEDVLYLSDVRTSDAGLVRIAVARLDGRWGMRLGIGSLVDRVPADASAESVLDAWLERWDRAVSF